MIQAGADPSLNRNDRRSFRGARVETTDPILDDLRAFAHDLGVGGAGSMSKDELIETLRQRYVLETLLRSTAPSRRAVSG